MSSLLLVGCSPEDLKPTTMRGELEQLKIPISYVVVQNAYDTGYAGVEDTGEYNETLVYTVTNEAYEDQGGRNEPLTMSDIKQELWEYVDLVEPSADVKDFGCYEYVQWGVKKVKACFIQHEITRYEVLRTKGNHQDAYFSWTLQR